MAKEYKQNSFEAIFILYTPVKPFATLKPSKCPTLYWVNPSKRGGMDGVFRGLAENALWDLPRATPEENPEEQPCQPEKNPVHPNSFTWIYILFKIGHFDDVSDFFKY